MSSTQSEWDNLPADVSTFVGRRAELDDLRGRLTASRLVTLTGPGGVGKTRLALKVAHECRRAFPDGRWFVDLAHLTEPSDIAETVATAIGAIKQSNRQPLAQLRHFLRGRTALIVLDNCEHLVDACAVLTADLLRAAPRLRVLATSRQTLRVQGEHIFDVPPMPIPQPDRAEGERLEAYDSVALLLARAADSSPGFAITDDNRAEVARLCARLDGIPLAIELAAARLRALSLADVLARLEQRFELLTNGGPATVPRQQTLLALIDWSYALCSSQQQLAWARLSIFVGSFDLTAAEEIVADHGLSRGDIADTLDELVRRSIVLAESSADRMRYRLLETLRAYGRRQLAASGETLRLAIAHRDYYLHCAEISEKTWYGPAQAAWLADARNDHANVRAAFEYSLGEAGEPEKALAIATGLRWFWIAGGYLTEGRRWLEAALKGATEPTADIRTTALCLDAFLALLQGDVVEAGARVDEIQGLPETHRPGELRGYVAEIRGMTAMFLGQHDTAIEQFEASLADYQSAGRVAGEVSATFQLAITYLFAGRSERAMELCDRSQLLSKRTGEQWGASYTFYALAFDRWLHGDFPGALDPLRRSYAIVEEFQDNLALAHLTELAAWNAASDSRFRESAVLLGVARTVWDGLGTSMSAFGPYLAECQHRAERSTRRALGDDEFQTAFDEGTRQHTHRAITQALGITSDPTPPYVSTKSLLTRREEQVARLVADGWSNRQIAVELVLSSRTVETHVQHILAKLCIDRRAQVAAWMAEHHGAAHVTS